MKAQFHLGKEQIRSNIPLTKCQNTTFGNMDGVINIRNVFSDYYSLISNICICKTSGHFCIENYAWK